MREHQPGGINIPTSFPKSRPLPNSPPCRGREEQATAALQKIRDRIEKGTRRLQLRHVRAAGEDFQPRIR